MFESSLAWRNFRMGVKAEKTWSTYSLDFQKFLDFVKLHPDSLVERAQDRKWFEQQVIDFLWIQRQRVEAKEVTSGRVWSFQRTIKCFSEMNDILVNWRKIERTLPIMRRHGEDRTYTKEELRGLVGSPDVRVGVMVLMGASSGIRFGAWNWLRWKHVKPIERNGNVIAARLTVYAGEPEQYVSFCTPEAWRTLKGYIDFRAAHGETIGPESPLLRNRFLISVREATIEERQRQKERYDLVLNQKGTPHFFAKDVIPLNEGAARHILERAAWRSGLRLEPKRTHEVKITHGLRKYYKTRAEQVMKPANVEVLMGHSLGVSDSYYKVTEDELLEDYLRAVPFLTVLPESPEARVEENEREAMLQTQYRDVKRTLDDLIAYLRAAGVLPAALPQAP